MIYEDVDIDIVDDDESESMTSTHANTIDEKILELDISDGPRKVLKILQEISNTHAVEKVYLSRAFPSPRRAVATEEHVTQVLESIVALPKIEHLSVGYASGSFPIHLLMKALADNDQRTRMEEQPTTSTIASLVLLGVKLTSRETRAAAETIRQGAIMSRLKTVSLENCKSDSSLRYSKHQRPLDVFVSALASIASLESLSLKTIPAGSMHDIAHFPWLKELQITHMTLSETSLKNIGKCTSLEKLELETITEPLPSVLVRCVARMLNSSYSNSNNNDHHNAQPLGLRHLKLRDLFSDSRMLSTEATNCFWHMIEHNETLEEVDFISKWNDSMFGISIAHALRNSHTTTTPNLQRLHLQTRIDADAKNHFGTSLHHIAQSLRYNTTLKHFSFHLTGGLSFLSNEEIHHVFLDPFERLFSLTSSNNNNKTNDNHHHTTTNYSLETITLEYRNMGKLPLSETIQFALTLNQAGRRKLLLGGHGGNNNHTTATIQDWMQVILSNQQNLSVVFYFLSVYPMLCQHCKNIVVL
jgi:hypothetical protein